MEITDLLRSAARNGASDILLTAGMVPVIRWNGCLSDTVTRETVPAEAIDRFRRELIGSSEAMYQKNQGFDASLSLPDGLRCRINFFTTIRGPALAARPLQSGDRMEMEGLCLPAVLKDFAAAERGLILVTGATGSGKTTTLSAMVHSINTRFRRHILMIEDPIEYVHNNQLSIVTQREVDSSVPGTFVQALRFALRENPDVIVIGEIRDAEAVQVALQAALTGHLVIATLHTADAVQSIERLLGLFPESRRTQGAQELALALHAVISQQLLPRADADGMIPALEILQGTPTVKKAIAAVDLNTLDQALQRGTRQGMIPFNRALLALVMQKKITPETARTASPNPEELDLLLRGMESGNDVFLNRSAEHEAVDIDMKALLRAAIRNGASDLLLTADTPPMLKRNGILRSLELPALSGEQVERLLYSVISRRQRIGLEEHRELDFALSVRLKQVMPEEPVSVCRFRLNAFYQRGALGLAARVIQSRIPSPETLEIPPALVQMMQQKQGLVLVTGPTGSGKSTTLASLVDTVNRSRACHVITIEDPIEYVHANRLAVIEQRELHADTLSFAGALKAALREAPDVIMVGEMRDMETIASALTAAETGHLVLATIHTNSAPQTVDRIVDSFPPVQQNQIRQQLAATLLGIASQRLIPSVSGESMVPAFEIMAGTPPIRALIREGRDHLLQSSMETGTKDGMCTMAKALAHLLEAGRITEAESRRFTAQSPGDR